MPIKIGDMKLYNVEELATLLQLTDRTVRDMLRTGQLAGTKFGGRWYVSETKLRERFEEPAMPAREG